jgi:hypothetical protein
MFRQSGVDVDQGAGGFALEQVSLADDIVGR